MLYADNACIVSRTSSSLEKMMTVIVTACREFGLTVSEAKTETMLLHSQTGTLGINKQLTLSLIHISSPRDRG